MKKMAHFRNISLKIREFILNSRRFLEKCLKNNLFYFWSGHFSLIRENILFSLGCDKMPAFYLLLREILLNFIRFEESFIFYSEFYKIKFHEERRSLEKKLFSKKIFR